MGVENPRLPSQRRYATRIETCDENSRLPIPTRSIPVRKSNRVATILLAASFGLLGFAARAAAEVALPAVISSHMVLQREIAAPIWGTAAPGERVTVKFRDQQKRAEAAADGKWLVKLDPLKAGGPDTLTVSGSNTLTLTDVLVGEVWLGSGQSNMEMAVNSYIKGDDLRIKRVAQTFPRVRLIRAGEPGWCEAIPASNGRTSALLFSFGVALHEELDVPVGLMVAAVGATPSGFWLSEEAFQCDAACKEQIAKLARRNTPETRQKAYERALARWEKDVASAKEKGAKQLPGKPEMPRKPGQCGGKLGHLYEAKVRPLQPFAIRGVLWDQGESGTDIEGVDQFTLMGALIRGWRSDWRQGDFPFIYIQKPSGGGCAWDPADSVTAMSDKFAPLPENAAGDAPQYVDEYVRIMQYPNTAMAISSDLGSGLHPVNKSGYGARAARVAMAVVYGKKIEYYGPVYKAHQVEGDKIRIALSHVGQGLAFCHGEKLQGFAVAGGDNRFFWADAAIDGDTVVVSSPKVAKPVAVRYGLSYTHPWANLFNKDGLPAVPFHTDAW